MFCVISVLFKKLFPQSRLQRYFYFDSHIDLSSTFGLSWLFVKSESSEFFQHYLLAWEIPFVDSRVPVHLHVGVCLRSFFCSTTLSVSSWTGAAHHFSVCDFMPILCFWLSEVILFALLFLSYCCSVTVVPTFSHYSSLPYSPPTSHIQSFPCPHSLVFIHTSLIHTCSLIWPFPFPLLVNPLPLALWSLSVFKTTLPCARFGSTHTKIGTVQRRLAWPLRKDDTQIREAFRI